MGISEIVQCTNASHAILFNCAAAFGNQAVVRTISNPHHIVVRTISNPHHIVVRTISNPHHIVVRISTSLILFNLIKCDSLKDALHVTRL